MPDMYEFLKAEGYKYTNRLPANAVLQENITWLLTRPVGRPPLEVRRFHASFSYRAGSWNLARRVVAKMEWHPGELYPRVGFIVTNMTRPAERVVAFYNHRGTAEQWIKRRYLYPAFLSPLCRQRGTAATASARLQPGQLLLHPGAARGGEALVDDDAAQQAGEDRRQDCSPWPVGHLPAGRSDGAPKSVSANPGRHRGTASIAAGPVLRGGAATGRPRCFSRRRAS
jgi:hypothetical protein